MRTRPTILEPDPNNQNSIEVHKRSVLTEYAALFALIESALRDSAPKAKDFFSLMEGPVDLSVHATLTRYLCKRFLASQDISAEEDDSSFELGKIPNCGLCLNGSGSQVRVLKATVNGVPKATSDARSRFYCSNQYMLPFGNANGPAAESQIPLSLVVLWTLDNDLQFRGMEIACPKRERADGSVECYWLAEWCGVQGAISISQDDATTQVTDLDEIRAIQKSMKATS